MGQSANHALGQFEKVYAKRETTFGTPVAPAGTDALKCKTFNVQPSEERTDRDDKRASRSVLERIEGPLVVGWSLNKYLIPSGSAGTTPDDGEIWKTAFGTETVVGGTSVTYTLSSVQNLGSLSIIGEMNGTYMESVVGAWVDKVSINIDGANKPEITFEGGAKDYGRLGANATVNGAHVATDTTIVINAANIRDIRAGTLCAFASEDNSGAGYLITAVDYDTNIVTISPGLANGINDTDAVLPFVPTETTAGSPIPGVLGTYQLDSVAFPITAATIEIANNSIPIDGEAGQKTVTDYIPGPTRIVTGSVSIRVIKAQTINIGKIEAYANRNLDLVCGTVAGKKVQISLPTMRFDQTPVTVPQNEISTVTIPFKALGSSGEDEVSVKFF